MATNDNHKYNSTALKDGQRLNNRYVVKSVIGVGGFGITYQGYDIYNGSICAIKELFINDTVIRGEDGREVLPYENKKKIFEHGVKRFMEEASILCDLNGTPNVVRIIDYFKENNTAYFVMDYIDGRTLKGFMSEYGGRIPLDEGVRIISKVGRTLESINKKYYIFHRDLSPENILLDRSNEPIIIDFGNAKNYMRDKGNSLSIVLKPGFAPPEQYTGKDQGPWTDVYSLAGIFYYITTGERVPPATERVMGASYMPLAQKIRGCSQKISDAVDEALAISPKDRTQSTGLFVDMLVIKNDGIPLRRDGLPCVNVTVNGVSQDCWRIPSDANIVIGRDGSLSNIVILDNTQLSKQHLVVSYISSEHLFEVTDISTNGVYQNGIRLKKERAYKYEPGVMLMLGKNICVLELELQ